MSAPAEPAATDSRWRRLRRRHPRLVKVAAVLVGLGVLGVGLIAGTAVYVRTAAAPYVFDVSKAPATPVGLVLGAEVYADGTPSPFLRGRLDVAKQLYDAGTIKVILVSGDNGTTEYDEPTAMRDYLIAAGVPARQVVADFAGFDTYDSCYRARDVFGVTRLVMISQAYHVPRAVVTCRALGLDVIGVGDVSAQAYPAVWRSGERREVLANLKMIYDLVSRRVPTLGPRETSVDEGLR